MRQLALCSAALLVFLSFSHAQAPLLDTPELEQKVNAIVGKMTLEQKIDLLGA